MGRLCVFWTILLPRLVSPPEFKNITNMLDEDDDDDDDYDFYSFFFLLLIFLSL